MAPPPLASIEEIRARVATGKGAAERGVKAALARIERFDSRINSFIEVFKSSALAAARAVDASGKSGALAGVPVAHKDIFYRRDRAPTCGVATPPDLPPMSPAIVPDRLTAAGAVELGVLGLSEFCFGTTGANAAHGDVRNPWDLDRVVGGSSSGSGAAVAAGFVAAALGTDSGGSVRVPAALCGVVGLKPTHGLLPTDGVFPMTLSLDCVGVLARSVADCARVFAVAADREFSPAAPRQPRVGVPSNYYLEDLDPAVAGAFDAALRALETSGAKLVAVAVPEGDDMRSLLRIVMRAEGVAIHAGLLAKHPEDYPVAARRFLESGFGVAARDYIDALRLRDHYLARSLREVFDRVDVLLTPTTPMVAPTYAEIADATSEAAWRVTTQLARCTQPATYMGLPALSVPFGDGDLPVGLQLIAAPGREDVLFGVAGALEAAWPPRRPPFDHHKT
jgi:aspartyl-tRNA(Asn)/glutamyl-tRNA(Gln) amidotransferase subunit A